jgi:hypothetical protein
MPLTTSAPCACDPVAAAVEKQLREMDAEGYGALIVKVKNTEFDLTFGDVAVRAETYDIGLVRLAGALLSHPDCGTVLTSRLRCSMKREHV